MGLEAAPITTSQQERLQTTLQTAYCLETWKTLRGLGQQHLGTRLTTGCLGGEKKVGKGMGLGCMGTNKHEKMEAGGTEGSGCMQNGANQYECVSIPWAWSSESFLSSNTSTSFFFYFGCTALCSGHMYAWGFKWPQLD